jgi:hypothetical protein
MPDVKHPRSRNSEPPILQIRDLRGISRSTFLVGTIRVVRFAQNIGRCRSPVANRWTRAGHQGQASPCVTHEKTWKGSSAGRP